MLTDRRTFERGISRGWHWWLVHQCTVASSRTGGRATSATRAISLALALFACLGCGPKAPGEAPPAASAAAGSAATTATVPAAEKPAPFREYWEEHFIKGAKIGHTHTAYFHEQVASERLVRIESQVTMVLTRADQRIEQSLDNVSWETEAGDVRRFRHTMNVGGSQQLTRGTVVGREATLTLVTAGKATTSSIPWPEGTRGESGANDELRRRPLQPGESRTIAMFVPVLNQIAQVSMTARGRDPTQLAGTETRELLRVDMQAELPGGIRLPTTVWVDEQGETWKSYMPGLEQTTLRTSAERATANDPQGLKLDIGFAAKVTTTPPLVKAHDTKLVRYRIALDGGDSASVFLNGESQRVRRLDDGTAEVTVVALRPDSPRTADVKIAPPTDGDRLPNNWIQSDDPTVVKLAAEAAGDATDPWGIGVRMEQHLRARWHSLPISSAFATAADAAKTLTGDCTEFAVVLAAMLRARGIPAKTAIGLVYVDSEQAFLYHMWTEAYIGERWLPLDAAWGRGGTSAAYLKIAETNLAGVDPLAAMLPVAQVMGKLKIEVLEQR